MLSCKQMTQRASSYYDDELSLFEKIQFNLHLLMCAHCKQFIKNLKLAIDMIKAKKLASNNAVSEEVVNGLKVACKK